MKKMMLLAAILCAGMAQAAEPPYLVFTNTAGQETMLSATSLQMKVNGNSLEVTHLDGTQTFVLTELASMRFEEIESGLEEVLTMDESVRVFSILGTDMGVFNSAAEAMRILSAGSYVFTNGSTSQTIILQ